VSNAAYISDITEEIQDVSTVADLAPEEAPVFLFKPTAIAKPTTARGRSLRLRTILQAAGVIALLAVAGYYGDYYWTTGRFLISTDDAYVQAHSVMISPKISGYISEVPVDDNQPVKAGAVLARIDPRDYQTALDQAHANVAVAQASINTLNQQIAQQQLVVEQDRQQVVSDQAALVFSQQDFQRYTHLATTGYGTVQRAQQAQADITESRASARHHGGRRRREADRRF
jgi:membrane fusion protein, multidrug efflux system